MNTNGKIESYYSDFDEQGRLSDAWGQVEFIRTCEIISRFLPASPAVVLDIGGAAGRYSLWLSDRGYDVHLIDRVPLHIEQAVGASAAQPEASIASCCLGDARQLDFDDQSADAVLLLGPLCHLTEASDRQTALQEAFRVLKPSGCLFSAGISRFASTIVAWLQVISLTPNSRKSCTVI